MTTIRKRRLSPQPRRALELLKLLASSPHGTTEALLVRAHGCDGDMGAGLLRAELATSERETMKAGAKSIEAVRLQITSAGRKAIDERGADPLPKLVRSGPRNAPLGQA